MNALKYAIQNSSIHIAVKRDNNQLTVSIKNITAVIIDNIDHLKDKFTRSDDYKEGCGLGLWIINKLMLLNNGKLILSKKDDEFQATLIFHL